jgi:hypothetical protein
MLRPSHPPCLENPTNIWQEVQIVQLPQIEHSIMCIRKAIRTGTLKARKEKERKKEKKT